MSSFLRKLLAMGVASMSVTVFHWRYVASLSNPSVGHVALKIVPKTGAPHYLSWYPATEKSPKALVAIAGKNNTEVEDKKNGPPSDVVVIEGLDEAAMITFVQNPRLYSLFGTSCAQVVADALRAGIGGKYKAGLMNANPIWTPLTAKDFAVRIKGMLAQRVL